MQSSVQRQAAHIRLGFVPASGSAQLWAVQPAWKRRNLCRSRGFRAARGAVKCSVQLVNGSGNTSLQESLIKCMFNIQNILEEEFSISSEECRKQKCPTFVRIAEDILVLCDPARRRLVYVMETQDNAAKTAAQVKGLMAACLSRRVEPRFAYLLSTEHPGQHLQLAEQLYTACGMAGIEVDGTQQQGSVEAGLPPSASSSKPTGPDWSCRPSSRAHTPRFMTRLKRGHRGHLTRAARKRDKKWGEFVRHLQRSVRGFATPNIHAWRNWFYDSGEGWYSSSGEFWPNASMGEFNFMNGAQHPGGGGSEQQLQQGQQQSQQHRLGPGLQGEFGALWASISDDVDEAELDDGYYSGSSSEDEDEDEDAAGMEYDGEQQQDDQTGEPAGSFVDYIAAEVARQGQLQLPLQQQGQGYEWLGPADAASASAGTDSQAAETAPAAPAPARIASRWVAAARRVAAAGMRHWLQRSVHEDHDDQEDLDGEQDQGGHAEEEEMPSPGPNSSTIKPFYAGRHNAAFDEPDTFSEDEDDDHDAGADAGMYSNIIDGYPVVNITNEEPEEPQQPPHPELHAHDLHAYTPGGWTHALDHPAVRDQCGSVEMRAGWGPYGLSMRFKGGDDTRDQERQELHDMLQGELALRAKLDAAWHLEEPVFAEGEGQAAAAQDDASSSSSSSNRVDAASGSRVGSSSSTADAAGPGPGSSSGGKWAGSLIDSLLRRRFGGGSGSSGGPSSSGSSSSSAPQAGARTAVDDGSSGAGAGLGPGIQVMHGPDGQLLLLEMTGGDGAGAAAGMAGVIQQLVAAGSRPSASAPPQHEHDRGNASSAGARGGDAGARGEESGAGDDLGQQPPAVFSAADDSGRSDEDVAASSLTGGDDAAVDEHGEGEGVEEELSPSKLRHIARQHTQSMEGCEDVMLSARQVVHHYFARDIPLRAVRQHHKHLARMLLQRHARLPSLRAALDALKKEFAAVDNADKHHARAAVPRAAVSAEHAVLAREVDFKPRMFRKWRQQRRRIRLFERVREALVESSDAVERKPLSEGRLYRRNGIFTFVRGGAAAAESEVGTQRSQAAVSALMDRLRAPVKSHQYLVGYDVLVMVPGAAGGNRSMLDAIATAWDERERRLMHPTVTSGK